MLKAHAEVLIERAPHQVFQFVADDFLLNYPRWSPEVQCLEAITRGPMQVGWVGRQIRLDQGRRSDSQFRVTVFDAGRQLTFEGMTAPYRIDYQFRSLLDQTRVSFTFELLELSLTLRPFKNMVRRAVQQTTDRMVTNLKTLVECELAPHTD
jgi:hypothetical protein